jgi:O-antigen ligase
VRVNEIQWLFEQLGDDYISGWGFGSVFYSTIRYHNRLFESAPHIGIVTPLLKGGLIMAVAFIVIPLAMCLGALRRRTPEARAAMGCVLVYIVTASLSGGWYPYQTLMFGVGVGMATIKRRPRPEFAGPIREPHTFLPVQASYGTSAVIQ